MYKWRKELETGQYYELLRRGYFDKRPEDVEPEIGGLDFYLDAFWELSSCRPGGFDLQPIPFTAIAEYSRIYELGDIDEFAYLIRRLDNLYLSLYRAESDKKQGDKGGGKNGNQGNKSNR
jgi:hypothetical protein